MNKFKVVTNIMLDMKIEFDDGFELTRAAVLMVIDSPFLHFVRYMANKARIILSEEEADNNV